jgi:hypothetical protein
MIITDEMVKKAVEVYWDDTSSNTFPAMRAALEAVAPMLIAQGLREAAEQLRGLCKYDLARAIERHAQELDPK